MKLQVLNQRDILGKPFVIYGDIENPLFMAKDIAGWIEHTNATSMLAGIDEDEKIVIKTPTKDCLEGMQNNTQYTFLTEDGLYEVLMQSRKPIAKQFKKKIKEILKDIRKNGMYATQELLDNPDLLIKIATKLKEERERTKLLEVTIEQQKPKVLFADSVASSKTTILVGEMAKLLKQNGIEIGQNRMFVWLRENGYLIKRKGTDYNMPTQYSMQLGLFEIKETSIAHADGHITINKTPKLTGKGQIYFIDKFSNM